MINIIGYFFLANLIAIPLIGLIYLEALLCIVVYDTLKRKWKKHKEIKGEMGL